MPLPAINCPSYPRAVTAKFIELLEVFVQAMPNWFAFPERSAGTATVRRCVFVKLKVAIVAAPELAVTA
jgi:hypothetical protein